MITKRLDSGYWHVWIDMNRFAQWPCNRPPRDEDFFGWWSALDKAEAARRVATDECGVAKGEATP